MLGGFDAARREREITFPLSASGWSPSQPSIVSGAVAPSLPSGRSRI